MNIQVRIVLIAVLVAWFASPAYAGSDHQAFEAALQLRFGINVPRDAQAAQRQFDRLARRGHVPAQLALAQMLELGEGGRVDTELALWWYRNAANTGSVEAMRRLGQLYMAGKGVAQNQRLGMRWLMKASAAGSEDAGQDLAAFRAAASARARPAVAEALPASVQQAKPAPTVTARVTSSGARLRAAASTQSETVGVLAQGARVRVLETRGKWLRVETDALNGYVYAPLLTIDHSGPGQPEASNVVAVNG